MDKNVPSGNIGDVPEDVQIASHTNVARKQIFNAIEASTGGKKLITHDICCSEYVAVDMKRVVRARLSLYANATVSHEPDVRFEINSIRRLVTQITHVIEPNGRYATAITRDYTREGRVIDRALRRHDNFERLCAQRIIG